MAEQCGDMATPQNSRPLQATVPVRRRSKPKMASPYRRRANADRSGRNLTDFAMLFVCMPDSYCQYRDVPKHWLTYCARRKREQNLASQLVLLARNTATIDEQVLICLSCEMIPFLPVTGPCGHTRCFKCVQANENCPCKISHSPWQISVNITIKDILGKLLATDADVRKWLNTSDEKEKTLLLPPLFAFFEGKLPFQQFGHIPEAENNEEEEGAVSLPIVDCSSSLSRDSDLALKMSPISPKLRLSYAGHLIQSGQLMKAAPQLAHVAASSGQDALFARCLLVKLLSELTKTWTINQLEEALFEEINSRAPNRWMSADELGCVICCDTFNHPVTTPCGHTFCRQCIERSLDYRSTCALCMQVLNNFDFKSVGRTEFVQACLVAIDAVPEAPPDPNLIPILTCTVFFPGLPSPLFLFKPRYWYMIRRIMSSETRRFGVVPADSGEHASIGTILELRESIHMDDGCTIVSTIGISRFRVLERDITDGWCDVARVEPLVDLPIPVGDMVLVVRDLARLISYKTALWIKCFSPEMRYQVQRLFGPMPQIDIDGDWWRQPDGPVWLWWIICILPVPTATKTLLLGMNCLVRRMRMVIRTLNMSFRFAQQSLHDCECALIDWWQQRQL